MLRYLLQIYRADELAATTYVDVRLIRPSNHSFKTVVHAAGDLLLRTVWPFFNREIGQVSYQDFEAKIAYIRASVRLQLRKNHSVDTFKSYWSPLFSHNSITGAITNAIHQYLETPPPMPQSWAATPAFTIWQGRETDLLHFVKTGYWQSLEFDSWEVAAINTLKEVSDQVYLQVAHYPFGQCAPQLETYFNHVTFIITLLYLNLFQLHCTDEERVARLSLHATQVRLRHSRGQSLLVEASKHANKASNWSIDFHGDEWQATILYMELVRIELDAYEGPNGKGKYDRLSSAWRIMYRTLCELKYIGAAMDDLRGYQNKWVATTMRKARNIYEEMVRESGCSNLEDKGHGCVSWQFFRRALRTLVTPVVMKRYGQEAGKFYRELLMTDFEDWKKGLLVSMLM